MQIPKTKDPKPRRASARLLQSHRFLYEIKTTASAYFLKISPVDWKEPALVRAVFVNAAGGCSVAMLFQKRTLEENLATGPAAITVAAAQTKRCDYIVFSKIGMDKPAKLSVCLTSAKSRVFNRTRTPRRSQSLFERSLLVAPVSRRSHRLGSY
jgi:hypothetical protein